MWAARRDDDVAVKLLLEANANPNLMDNKGFTALFEATWSRSATCTKLLLAANANVEHINAASSSILHHAAERAECKDFIWLLVAAGANINMRNMIGSSPLAGTCYQDNLIAATTLLDLGADIDSQDFEGDTPLLDAVFQHADRVTQLLLQRGACYTLIASNGDSILHLAAKSGGTRTLNILIAAELKGIDPYAQNRDGKTATRVAQERSAMPPDFLPKIYELVMGIDTRNLRLAQMPKQDTRPPNASRVGTARAAMPLAKAFRTSWDVADSLTRHCSNRAILLGAFVRNAALEQSHQVQATAQSRLQRHPFISLFVGWAVGIITAVVILSRSPSSTGNSESRQMES